MVLYCKVLHATLCRMKYIPLFVLLFSFCAEAQICLDSATHYNRQYKLGLSEDEKIRLCHKSVDDGPIRCYLDASVYLSRRERMGIPAGLVAPYSVTLCKGARLAVSDKPIRCYDQTSIHLSDAAAVLACSGARNTEPAKCANLLNNAVWQHHVKATDVQIGFACRHSMNAKATLRLLDSWFKNRTSSFESLQQARDFNERHYY